MLKVNKYPVASELQRQDQCELNFLDEAIRLERYGLWQGDCEEFLSSLSVSANLDLIVSSPPYNIGKEYESKKAFQEYLDWQRRVLRLLVANLSNEGSLCWQVGNHTQGGSIIPLDAYIIPYCLELGLKLRNRIVWRYGHGLHAKRRFSGRYEVVLWFTKSDDYHFDLDQVRVPSKYPGKRAYKGPNRGKLSSHPNGKNPEDIWEIPNCTGNHVEKTIHPCQFPVGLVERLVLSLSKKGDLVFDPFAGVSSTGVAAILHGRRYWGCELKSKYNKVGAIRMLEALEGNARYRPHDRPIFDHTQSNLSKRPKK